MEEREFEFLKQAFKSKFKYITRCKNGSLHLHYTRPVKIRHRWRPIGCLFFHKDISKDIFTNIKWDDKKPFNIKKKLKNIK